MLDITTLLHEALGEISAAGIQVLEEKSSEYHADGVVVRNYLVRLGKGAPLTITVADPVVRRFHLPVIAAHQTNDSGRKEVFGASCDYSLNYGLQLAQRGHRVFGIDLRWTGERASGPQWAFANYNAANLHSSSLGADCNDFRNLIRIMREVFSEQSPINWIGHSHGGVNGYLMAALESEGTFAQVVCNAAYTAMPDSVDAGQLPNFCDYFRKPYANELWHRLDELLAMASAKANILLNCYLGDDLLPFAVPGPERLAALRSIAPLVNLKFYEGGHTFPPFIQLLAFEFLELGEKITEAKRTPGKMNSDLPFAVSGRRGGAEKYFDTPEVWRNRPEVYQVQLRETLKALLGSEKKSVLDVGCGNGLIANYLPSHLEITAVDLSETALQNVRVPKVKGSITSLPFPDKSFDFVYCFDVIEHLTEVDMSYGLNELQRVARKHVLIAIPLNEDLASNSVRCANCGCLYHINGHLRSHNSEWLEQLPITDAFERTAIFLSGDTTTPPLNPLIDLDFENGVYPDHAYMSCPECGSCETNRPNFQQLSFDLSQISDSFRSAEWCKQLRRGEVWCDRSEGVLLLTRKGHCANFPVTSGVLSKKMKWLDVNFNNFLQAVFTDFVPGSIWPRFIVGRGARLCEGGLELINSEFEQASPTMLRFPVFPRHGDTVSVEVSSNGDGAVSIFGVDGISGAIVNLLEKKKIQDASRQQLVFKINVVWALDRFGIAMDLYLYGGARVHRISYLPSVSLPELLTATVQPGVNIFQLPVGGNVPIYWSYHALAHGELPVPTALGKVKSHHPKSIARLFETVWEYRLSEKESLLAAEKVSLRNFELTKILEGVNLKNSELAKELDKVSRQNVELTYRISQRFSQRTKRLGKKLFCFAKGKVRRILKVVNRVFFSNGILDTTTALSFSSRWRGGDFHAIGTKSSGPSVLIVSHMFPHPDQPGLGSFVLEQAQALQQAGVNVCVISGRPFWLTSNRTPFRLLGGLYNYARLYFASSIKWWVVDGVPVRFLPYPILGPFWAHGWAYRFAIYRNRKEIAKDFDADLIHAHTGYLDGMAASALSKWLRIPYVITEHTGPFSSLMKNPIVRRATLGAMARAAQVVSVSNSLQEDIAAYQNLGKARMQVIPNVVKTEMFGIENRWAPQANAPRILFVGYFVPVKNLPLLIEAFQLVLKTKPSAKLILVGGGEVTGQQSELMAAVERLGLTGALEVKGYVERQEVARLMREECDLFVLASKSETFGCVVAEALASGKPVVITPCGGPEDIVADDSMGAICKKNNDSVALADSILDVVNRLNSFKPHQMRQSIVERFSPDAVASQLLVLYERVLVKSN